METTSAGLESSSQKTCSSSLFTLAVHVDLLKGFRFSFAHGIISAIVVEDHCALVGALIGLVASASASETLEGTRLDSLIGWGRS